MLPAWTFGNVNRPVQNIGLGIHCRVRVRDGSEAFTLRALTTGEGGDAPRHSSFPRRGVMQV